MYPIISIQLIFKYFTTIRYEAAASTKRTYSTNYDWSNGHSY